MKHLFTLFICCAVLSNAWSQKLRKVDLGTSGCSVQFYGKPEAVKEVKGDGYKVYTVTAKTEEGNYGLVLKEYDKPFAKDSVAELRHLEKDMVDAEESFQVMELVSYGYDWKLKDFPEVKGITTFWRDEEGIEYKVQGWTNSQISVIVYAGYPGDKQPNYDKINLFLQSFKFPSLEKKSNLSNK